MVCLINIYVAYVYIMYTYFLYLSQTPAAEELSLLGVQLASQFLFHTGFRSKKSLRGPVIEWYVCWHNIYVYLAF